VASDRTSKPTLTERQAARRDWIVQAATELASEGGYDAVQMREVSARANVALGTLYRYFSSKDQLLVAVMGYWARELQAQIAARPPRGETTADRVTEVLRRAARALQDAPELTASLVTAMSSMSSDDPPALEATREVYDIVTAIIRGALRPGEELGDDVIRVLAMVWFAALFARVRGWEDPRQMGDDLENAVRLLVRDGRR
jgi:TetR/AcrR family transcriptional regulator, cholesterol catabolism regulator